VTFSFSYVKTSRIKISHIEQNFVKPSSRHGGHGSRPSRGSLRYVGLIVLSIYLLVFHSKRQEGSVSPPISGLI
jgi:hypothetical protein